MSASFETTLSQPISSSQSEERVPLRVYLLLIKVGVGFLFLFSAIFAFQNLCTQIYEQLQYEYLATLQLILYYVIKAIFCAFTPVFSRYYSYKSMMFVSAIILTLYVASGIWIEGCSSQIKNAATSSIVCSKPIIYSLVLLLTLISGSFESIIWCSVSSYLGICCKSFPNKSGVLFACFFGIFQLTMVVGMGIAWISFQLPELIYLYICLTTLGGLGCIMLFILPELQIYSEEQGFTEQNNKNWLCIVRSGELREGLVTFIEDLCMRDIRGYLHFFFMSGTTIGFIIAIVFRIVQRCLGFYEETSDLSDEQMQEMNVETSQYQLRIGLVEFALYFASGKLLDRFKAKPVVIASKWILATALTLFTLAYATSNMMLCNIAGVLIAVSDCAYNNTSYYICQTRFSGSVASYSTYNFLYGVGVSAVLILYYLLSSISFYLFMIVLIALVVLPRYSL